MLYSNPYSNADEHQRKYRTRNEQNMHISSTKRTRANTSEQHKSSPPFGTPCLLPSTDVFHPLQKPIECPLSSMEIHRCPPVLLSVLTLVANSKVSVIPSLGS